MKKAYLVEFTILSGYLRRVAPVGAFVALMMALSPGMLVAVPGIMTIVLGMGAIRSASNYDELGGWGAFRLALPLTRRDVVLARYGVTVTLMVLGALFGFVAQALLWVVGQVVPLPAVSEGVSTLFGGDVLVGSLVSVALCLPISIVEACVMLPLVFKFGSTKALQMVPLVMTMVAGCLVGVLAYGGFAGEGSGVLKTVYAWVDAPHNLALLLVGLAVVDLGILSLSAAAAVRFYERRDL